MRKLKHFVDKIKHYLRHENKVNEIKNKQKKHTYTLRTLHWHLGQSRPSFSASDVNLEDKDKTDHF